jgi:hypothetical protein
MAELSTVGQALERLTVFDLWSEAPFAGVVPARDGVYLDPFKQSVKNTPSFSISKDGKRWKDFADNRPASGVLGFAERCHPDLGKLELYRHLVGKAGLEWKESKAMPKKSAKEQREERLQAQRDTEAAMDSRAKQDQRARELPGRAAAVAVAPEFIMARYVEGKAYFEDEAHCQRLADKRGWPLDWVTGFVSAGYISCPLLPWAKEKRQARGLAFPMACPGRGYDSFDFVGYHQLYTNWQEKRKAYVYLPYVPRGEAKNDFQRELRALADERGLLPGDKIAPLPMVLGDAESAQVAVIVEGQWDALTLWGALDGLAGQADDVIVFGIRGAQGLGAFLDHWGAWFKSAQPRVWLMPDNDKAGAVWYDRERLARQRDITFEERLVHAGLHVARTLVPRNVGKDFNDLYKAKQPSAEALRTWIRRLELL